MKHARTCPSLVLAGVAPVARPGRGLKHGNPNQPETEVPIPACAMVKFKAGKEMKAEVLKLTPKPTKK